MTHLDLEYRILTATFQSMIHQVLEFSRTGPKLYVSNSQELLRDSWLKKFGKRDEPAAKPRK